MSKFRRFLGYFRGQGGPLTAAILLTLATTALTLPYPLIVKAILDRAIPGRDWPLLQRLLGLFLLTFLARGLLSYAGRYVLQKIGMRITCDLRKEIFAHLQNLSLKYYEGRQTGQIVARISDDTSNLFVLVTGVMVNLVTDGVTLLAVLSMLFWLHWPLALLAAAALPFFWLNYARHKLPLRRISKRHRRNWHRAMGFLHERIAGARLVKSFAMEEREIARFNLAIENDFNYYNQVTLANARLWVIADMISSLGLLLILGLGGWLAMQDASAPGLGGWLAAQGGEPLSVGVLVAFTTYIGFLFTPIVRLSDINASIDRALNSLDKIYETLDTPSFVAEAPGALVLPPVRGLVRFEGVHFSYDAGHKVLKDIRFEAQPGQMVALVGPSGSGKSTLINLLCRFYDPDQGSILLDGVDLRTVTLKSLRRQMGVVMQDNLMFSGSVLDNLRYGNPEAGLEAAMAAARTARAHEFIERLPQGYHTLVGERGIKLSGGQKQRLAIARALLADPRILIFDEATSALDSESEALVQEAMESSIKGRTTFVIAHRLSTILKADRILVLQEGSLVEEGDHPSLLASGGLYSQLFEIQFRRAARAAGN